MSRFLVAMAGLVLAGLPGFSWAGVSASNHVTLERADAAFKACGQLQGVNVLQRGKVICLRGKIDPSMFIGLVARRNDIARKPYVIVSGIGGFENSSIYIVRFLDPYDPVPVVGDMCASACAQFLFLMGRTRVILHCADIAFHGGPPSLAQIFADQRSDEVKENMLSARWRFEKFYRDRHISMDMVDKPPADVRKKLDAGQVVFWPWSINQLRGFGVDGIVSNNDPDVVVPADYGAACIRPLPPKADLRQSRSSEKAAQLRRVDRGHR